MNITVWKDEDIMPKKVKALPSAFDNNTGVMMHRVRQTNFIRKCVPALRKRNAKWVMLTDTDEYVLPSYSSWYFLNVTNRIPRTSPGNVLRMLKYHENVTGTNHTCVYMPRYFFGAKESSPLLVQKGAPKGIDTQKLMTQRFLFRESRQNPNGKNLINLERVARIEKFGGVHKITSVCPELDKMYEINQQHAAIVRVHHYVRHAEDICLL
jgi:hypothetical protein